MKDRNQFAGSYLELFTSSMFFFIALVFLLTWLTFFSPYELFGDEDRLAMMNYVLITLFALGPVMGILAGIAFDTLPLVYNIPSFEKTTMRHFLQLNGIGQLFIHIGIYSGNWSLFLELAGIGIILMCLALLTLTSSSMDIVKQKGNAGEVGIFSYAPGLVLVICSLLIASSWFLRDIEGMIEVGVAFIVAIFCTMMMSTTLLSHFNRRLGWEATNPATLPLRFLLLLLIGIGYVIISFLRVRKVVSEDIIDIWFAVLLLNIFFMVNPIKIMRFSIGRYAKPHSRFVLIGYLLLPLLSIVSIAPIWTGHAGLANIQPTHWLLIAYSCFFIVCGFAIYLHEDHLHYSPSTRITHWYLVFMFFISGVLMTWSLYDGAVLLDGEYLPVYIWIATQSIASILLAVLFIRHTIFPTDNWHRIPMFYDRLMDSKV
tara:strand:- start:1833 stop:3119 length:1287 start_codon:yes stop_codon:yes gene_type:complete